MDVKSMQEVIVLHVGRQATKKARRTVRMCNAQRSRRNMELLKKLQEKIS
jgi:hypothetical protein